MIKKMTKAIVMFIVAMMLIGLVGCGGKEQSKTFEIEVNGSTIDMKCDAKGDIVHTITQTSVVDLNSFTEDQLASLQETVDSSAASYKNIDGVTYTTDMSNNVLTEVITIDASSKDTIQAMSDAGQLPLTGDVTTISLEETEKALTGQGWTVKE